MEARVQTDDPLVMLYVPCGGEAEAKQIASRLLDERLIACANIYASRSLHRWKGATADEQEQVLVCKTLFSRSEAAAARVRQLHSYEVPCILTLTPARANDEFYRWVCGEVAGTEQVDSGQG
jgi:periplasmic divalent cation tolerance protein